MWLFLSLSNGAHSQSPLYPDKVVAAFPSGAQAEFAPSPVCDDLGVCGIFWFAIHSPDPNVTDILGTVVSPEGTSSPLSKVLVEEEHFSVVSAVGLEEGFAVLWDRTSEGHTYPVMQYYDETLLPRGKLIKLPLVQGLEEIGSPDNYAALQSIVRTPSGFAIYGMAFEAESSRISSYIYFVGRNGALLRPRQRLNEDPSSTLGVSGWNPLTARPDGSIVAVFEKFSDAIHSDVYVRRLSTAGVPFGPEILVNTELGAIQGWPVVASGPDGSFLVAWQRQPAVEKPDVILARRFSADGQPLGDPFQVNDVFELDQRYPVVAADSQGNYFIAWQSFYPASPLYTWEIKGRLFRSDGAPVTGEIRLNLERQFDQANPQVCFSPNGLVVAAWQSSSLRQIGDEGPVPVVRAFAASPGQEICAVDGAALSCDLARTGGPMELRLTWGGRPGEVTLLGDWNGDGRDDVCGFYLGRFRCDVNHAGRATAFERFGQEGDIPLLADVDGDGRADPCVWRAGSLLCDTARDGKVHLRLVFGPRDGMPLLGDLDGDHKADLCVVLAGHWSCLTMAGQESHFDFGEAGDSFALGDFHRSGQAGPCLLRGGHLRCAALPGGGGPETTLLLAVSPKALLLFGNLDGL